MSNAVSLCQNFVLGVLYIMALNICSGHLVGIQQENSIGTEIVVESARKNRQEQHGSF